MATQIMQIYKCGACGNTVAVVGPNAGTLSCCDQPMTLQEEQTADAATEKHVPILELVDGGIKVTVGSTKHPMEANHYIQWIELTKGERVMRQFLQPGDEPEARFCCASLDDVTARECCNKHGLWSS